MDRLYTSRRMSIINALAEKLKLIDGSYPYQTNMYNNVSSRLLFWDEIQEFPAIHLNAGSEARIYHGAGVKDRYMSVTIRCYVQEEDAILALEGLLEDVETSLEEHSRLAYKDREGNIHYTQQITIMTIDTDEGCLSPTGVGEILCEVRY